MPSLPQREAEDVKALRPLRGDFLSGPPSHPLSRSSLTLRAAVRLAKPDGFEASPVGLDALGLLR